MTREKNRIESSIIEEKYAYRVWINSVYNQKCVENIEQERLSSFSR